MIDKQYAKMI